MKKTTARALRKNLRLEFAAHHFVFHSKCARDISEVVNVAPERIVRWCNTPEWRNALRLWGYAGEPFVEDFYEFTSSSFSHVETRWIELFFGNSDLSQVINLALIQATREVYTDAYLDGKPHSRAVSIASREKGVPRRRVMDWAIRFDWEAGLPEKKEAGCPVRD